MPRALLALAVVAALAVPASAADRRAPRGTTTTTLPAPPPDPNLAAARDALVVAQEQLRIAGTGKPDVYGGHRKLALELVNTALEQVDNGLRVAAEDAARRAREAQQKPAPKRRRR